MKAGFENSKLYPAAILLLLAFGSFSGCLREIDLEVPQKDNIRLTIRSVLKGGELPVVLVDISSQANTLTSPMEALPVIGASVVLLDDEHHGLDIPMLEAGHYELIIPDQTYSLEVKPGHAYQLSVATTNGKNYLSGLETMYAVPIPAAIDQVSVQRTVINEVGNFENRQFLRFLINTPIIHPDNPGKSYLKWDLLGTFKFKESTLTGDFPPPAKTCYISETLSPDNIVVFDGSDNSQDNLSGFFLLEQPFDYRFVQGFYLSVFQQSLSPSAFKYWDEVGKLVRISGNFFDAPPGKVKGNFRNVDDNQEEVYGFFYATEQAVLRWYIPPSETQELPICPETLSPEDEGYPSICLDCRTRPGSTLVKPDFWEG